MPGGRPKGSGNKRKSVLLARLQKEFEDYHPVAELARIAMNPKNDTAIRLQAHKEVAKYVEPQLKAVEHTGETKHVLLTVAEQIKAAENASDSAD